MRICDVRNDFSRYVKVLSVWRNYSRGGFFIEYASGRMIACIIGNGESQLYRSGASMGGRGRLESMSFLCIPGEGTCSQDGMLCIGWDWNRQIPCHGKHCLIRKRYGLKKGCPFARW